MCGAAATTTYEPETTSTSTTYTTSTTPVAAETTVRATTRTLPKNLPRSVKCGEPVFSLPRSVIRKTTDLASRYTTVGINVYTPGTAQNLNRSKRVYGGKKPTHGSMPWLVSIIFGPKNDNQHRCGGAIIGKNFVVTAAHCTKGQTVDTVKITAGAFTSR